MMRRPSRWRSAERALALCAAAALLASIARADPVAVEPPPPCTYGDVVVRGDVHDDHARMLLDTTHRLPRDAAPRDLVTVRQAGFDSDRVLRSVVIDDLRALREAALAAGVNLAVLSAYRSFAHQEQVYAREVAALGEARARRLVARPGHSEHQLGTTVDLHTAGGPLPWDVADWAETPEGAWVVANAHRYGFVLSYPAGREEVTCYDYEPWHYRWLGRETAALLHASGETLREWLFARHPPEGAP